MENLQLDTPAVGNLGGLDQDLVLVADKNFEERQEPNDYVPGMKNVPLDTLAVGNQGLE